MVGPPSRPPSTRTVSSRPPAGLVSVDRSATGHRAFIGQYVDVRADATLVTIFHNGQLAKVHPRRPGGRWTDPDDPPAEKVGYAMRDPARLVAAARRHGPDVDIYAQRFLDDRLPWTRMRAVYRRLGRARRYGHHAVNTACGKAMACPSRPIHWARTQSQKSR